MFTHRHFAFALAAAAAIMCSAAAQAADNTRYISITGNNANACTLAAPCRTLHKGISVTPAGGELQILKSGFYGNNATVNKSMTINGNGHTVYLGTTIVVDSAGAVVALRGFTLNGQGNTFPGIRVIEAAAVHIERCVIHGVGDAGIWVSTPGSPLFVLDSVVRDNAGVGVDYAAGSRLTIDNSRFERNGATGVAFDGGGFAVIRGSTASGNSIGFGIITGNASIISSVATHNNAGFGVFDGGVLTLESSVAEGNSQGLFVQLGSVARLSHSTFVGNDTGIANTGTVRTLGNNALDGNTFNALGGGTVEAVTPF